MRAASECFYSKITFSYTKYFVHSYTVDVVFTLSYYGMVIVPRFTYARRNTADHIGLYWVAMHNK